MLNKVVLIGRICTDIELKYTAAGSAVTNFRLAVDRQFKNEAGEKETDFIDIVAWKQQAEFAATYLGKGRLIAVDGRLQVRDYEKDGQKRKAVEIVANDVRPLDKPKEQE
jgi:single-strand DNA-binding protein